MKAYLMNSAMMPQQGHYDLAEVGLETFAEYVILAHRAGKLENHVGYEQNLKLINEWTGIELEPDRSEVGQMEENDVLLIMKLKYRVQDTKLKADKNFQNSVTANDFQFFIAQYKPF